jgi:SagB-type dehydrogenase family enzyme
MIKSCLNYHRETSYDRNRMGGHFLDWANQPDVFKTYRGIEPVKLSREVELPKRKPSSLILEKTSGVPAPGIDLDTLSKLLLLTHTLTAKARSHEGGLYFRSAASAGALYPTEIYTATRGVAGLPDGLYYYAIHDHGLVSLRTGEIGTSLLEAAGLAEKALPVVSFLLTAVFFRSAWKYRGRAYRYHLLDTGHVEENLILALRALGLPHDVSYDFDDDHVNHLLGLDEKREAALSLVFLQGQEVAHGQGKAIIDQLPKSILEASRVSAREVDYPAIREIHEAGKKTIAGKVGRVGMSETLGVRPGEWRETESPASWNEIADYPDCVFTRRSKRNFMQRPVRDDLMAGLLQSLYTSYREGSEESLSAGFLADRVDGMAPGFYLLDRNKKAAGMVAQGSYIETMTRICLDQAWLVNAGVHFLFLANLHALDKTWGPRGYRYAMMTAGRLGQRLYIAATAMGLGCCGIGAFYDEEARELLGLNEDSRLLYLVAVGVIKKRT